MKQRPTMAVHSHHMSTHWSWAHVGQASYNPCICFGSTSATSPTLQLLPKLTKCGCHGPAWVWCQKARPCINFITSCVAAIYSGVQVCATPLQSTVPNMNKPYMANLLKSHGDQHEQIIVKKTWIWEKNMDFFDSKNPWKFDLKSFSWIYIILTVQPASS